MKLNLMTYYVTVAALALTVCPAFAHGGGGGYGGDVGVQGYFRASGTYVQPYMRSAPDGNFYNNYSTYGNVNPYTGQEGTKLYPPSGGTYFVPGPLPADQSQWEQVQARRWQQNQQAWATYYQRQAGAAKAKAEAAQAEANRRYQESVAYWQRWQQEKALREEAERKAEVAQRALERRSQADLAAASLNSHKDAARRKQQMPQDLHAVLANLKAIAATGKTPGTPMNAIDPQSRSALEDLKAMSVRSTPVVTPTLVYHHAAIHIPARHLPARHLPARHIPASRYSAALDIPAIEIPATDIPPVDLPAQ
jgi:hypothetical protein